VNHKSSRLTRRNLVQGAGAILAAAAAPRWGTAQKASPPPQNRSPTTDVMDILSQYMADAQSRILPPEVAEKAKEHVLDTLAAMVSGTELPPAKVALNFARFHEGAKTATVVGSDLLCGPAEAAFTNGMLAHSDETDDSHSPSHSHPGCAVVPAALATGELFDIDGKHFLRAVTLGYDIGNTSFDDPWRASVSDEDPSLLP
jgi:2-methylcitrate dehydratase MmgE/PrpD-like protein